MAQHPDSKYLQALRDNDSRLINEIYRKHSGQILSWVQKNNGSESDARDLFQEGLLILHYSAHQPDFKLTCPLGALLFTICRNRWINQLRRKKKEQEVRKVEANRYIPEPTTESVYERLEDDQIKKEQRQRAFDQLSETCQRLLRLLARGLSPAEIAERLGMSGASTVYRRKSACGGRWRDLLEISNEKTSGKY